MDDNSPVIKSHLENESDEDNEIIMTFGDDEMHYSDFENIEYVKFEEVNTNLRGRQGSECSINNMGGSSRKRTKNFTRDEYAIMSALLDEYSNILDVKRNDHKTNTLKNEAWDDITAKFNNTTHEMYRTQAQLKTFYENLRRKRKKQNESENCEKNNSCEKSSDSDITRNKIVVNKVHTLLPKTETNMPVGFKRQNNFLEYYQVKKLKLLEMEIEKTKLATEQQRRLFLLQEEKLMLEIQETRERLKRNRKLDVE